MAYNDFLIDSILPAREVHLLGGSPGVGKTTFLIQFLDWFRKGEPVFGFRTHPEKGGVLYISCDRSPESFKRALDRLRVPHTAFPWLTDYDIPSGPLGVPRAEVMLEWVHSKHPEVVLVVMDGLSLLVPEGRSGSDGGYSSVAKFLRSLRARAAKLGLTVLGTCHANKVKEGESYSNPRDRILGSTAWSGFSDLVLILDPLDPSNPENPVRVLNVLPREAPNQILKFSNEKGVLVPWEGASETEVMDLIQMKFLEFDPEAVWSIKDLHDKIGTISRKSVERWVKSALEAGFIVKTAARGTYQRVVLSKPS